MAERNLNGGTAAAQSPASGGPVNLRRMRIESVFRHDTRNLPRQERDKYSSFLWNAVRLDWGPKVSISAVVGSQQNAPVQEKSEDALKDTLDYYRKKDDYTELVRVLKFYAAYLLQQARRERVFASQLFLLFKAVDFLRMIVQYSPYSVNQDAETLVFAIFTDLGTQRPQQFGRYYETEQTVFQSMKRLQLFPSDHRARLRLAEQLVEQTSFYDAVVQYEFLMRFYPRMPRHADIPRGRAALALGNIYQNLIDNAGRHPGDMRKLRNFVERRNRDSGSRGREIPLPQGGTPAAAQRVARALLPTANRWYTQALNVAKLGAPRLCEAAFQLARNLERERRPKEALKILLDVKPQWKRLGSSAAAWELRLTYVELLINLAMKLQRRDVLSEALEDQREFRNELERVQSRTRRAEEEEDEALGEPPPFPRRR